MTKRNKVIGKTVSNLRWRNRIILRDKLQLKIETFRSLTTHRIDLHSYRNSNTVIAGQVFLNSLYQ